MGWGYCGEDAEGRPIGYSIEATCDHPGCNAPIDRGLSYACGDMHGFAEAGCDKYFCSEHRQNCIYDTITERWLPVCDGCYAEWKTEMERQHGSWESGATYTKFGHVVPELFMELEEQLDHSGLNCSSKHNNTSSEDATMYIAEILHRLQHNTSCHLTAEKICVELEKYEITIKWASVDE